MSERYSFSLTTFSPSGKLVQIEYALKAVEAGAPSVGIRATNGVVLAVEKKFTSKLIDETTIKKIEPITASIGMVYSGLSPDYRVLVKQARKSAQAYQMAYGEQISPEQLVVRTAAVMQEYTQSGYEAPQSISRFPILRNFPGELYVPAELIPIYKEKLLPLPDVILPNQFETDGVRPFGVSLLIAGWDYDNKRAFLYQCDPSGTYFPWKATALGHNSQNGKSFLEKRYNKDLELDDAVHAAILTLKESFEGQMTENNIEIGICNERGFRVLTPSEVKDYLAAIQ
ncbi:unnamed protein product [Echinostoma caproni]|uniref:Proteasome subunit alpha type n=2 Tax=Echinostomatoidea TaxID=404429 RepID=A0A183ASF4_9TREM|nr:unnamed protein product [Echinostoma caproni]